jgi:hypothetical protein
VSHFFLHGLVVDLPAAAPLAGLVSAAGREADLVIGWVDAREPDQLAACWNMVPIEHGNGTARFLELWRHESGDHLMRFVGATISDFRLSADGRRIGIWANPAVPRETLVGLALGPVLGVALRLRGALGFHAGAVASGLAAIVAGPSGAGKSTLIHALGQAGCQLVTDEMAIVDLVTGIPMVGMGLPGMRLMSDSLSALGGDAESWPFAPYTVKHLVTVAGAGSGAPPSFALGAIFLLGRRRADTRENSLVRQSPAAAMMALAGELYPPFLPLSLIGGTALFDLLAKLVVEVPVYRVSRPDSFGSLPDLCAQIRAIID